MVGCLWIFGLLLGYKETQVWFLSVVSHVEKILNYQTMMNILMTGDFSHYFRNMFISPMFKDVSAFASAQELDFY